jgi:hypothetical protein
LPIPVRRAASTVELEIAAYFVECHQHACLDVLAVLQSPAEQLRAAAEHDAANLCGAVLEREVDVPGRRMAEIGHFSSHPAEGKSRFEPLAGEAIEQGNRDHRQRCGQVGAVGEKVWHAGILQG